MTRRVQAKACPSANPRKNEMEQILNQFPDEMIKLPQWVLWKLITRGEKTTKVPYQPNGIAASSTNSATWSTFSSVMNTYVRNPNINGVGFVFSADDPYVGIDLDKCRDPKTGTVDSWASAILDRIDTYKELSPSGTGFHLIGKGKMPSKGRKKGQVEIYDSGRYFTVTGSRFNKSVAAAEGIQSELDLLYQQYFSEPSKAAASSRKSKASPPTKPPSIIPVDDQSVVTHLLTLPEAGAFKALNSGNWETLGYPSQSEADLALIGMLARNGVRRPEQLDRIFRSTGLMRDKWDEQRGEHTYGEMTIAKALEQAHLIDLDDAFVTEMNQIYAVIATGNKVKILVETADDNDFRLLSKTDFELLTCNTPAPKPKTTAARHWLNSPKRRSFDALVFKPGQNDPKKYNLWRGFSVQPKAGDCSLFWTFVHDAICAGSRDVFIYVRRYFAHMIQRPWERPEVALVLRGGQGTGKNTFVGAMAGLVKLHFCEVSSVDQLTGRFNAHMRNVIFMHANEATWGGNKSESGKLKAMITDETIPVEPKGLDILHIDNYLRLVISSNESWPVPVDADDRRFLILDVSPVYKQDTAFFAKLHAQLENGGLQALMHDLQTEDLTGFSPRNKPPTPFGADMKMRSADSPTRWLHDALNSNSWPHGGGSLFPVTGASTTSRKAAWWDDYQQWARKTSERYIVARDQFHKRMRELLGASLVESRPSAPPGQSREREFTLADIEQCRKAFATASGIDGSVSWDPL